MASVTLVWVGFGEFAIGGEFHMNQFEPLDMINIGVIGRSLKDIPIEVTDLIHCPPVSIFQVLIICRRCKCVSYALCVVSLDSFLMYH